MKTVIERFTEKTAYAGDCIAWTGTVNKKGYGVMSVNSKARYAHRLAYALFVGPIPEGLTIDHLCRNPLCVNTAHMEVVTHAVNIQRSFIGRPEKTKCRQGHPFSHRDCYDRPRCVLCERKWKREYKVRQKVGEVHRGTC